MWNAWFFDQILLTGYKFTQGIKFTDGNNHFEALISTQFIVSALVYFIFIIIIFLLLKIWVGLYNLLAKIYQKIEMKRKNKIHRKSETKDAK